MRYMFGDYSLDTQRYELRRAGDFIPLGPQVFNVLAYLVAHRDRVVSRDELFARLWPGQFVTDDALGRCIRAARRALGDRPEAPRYHHNPWTWLSLHRTSAGAASWAF
jgi:DNA-binding winged helix-turn-helix (wHTH) protein